MKLVKRAVKTTKRIQNRRRARAERGKITNTFASYFDAIACTGSGSAGHQAYDQATNSVAKIFGVDRVSDVQDIESHKPCSLTVSDSNPPDFWRQQRDLTKCCVSLDITLPALSPGDASSDAVDIADILLTSGFEPILRSTENPENAFRALFIRRSDIDAKLHQLRPVIEAAANPSGTTENISHQDIPVYIPCFNNQTYCQAMVRQLLDRQFTDITLIDNASPSAEMHRFLDEIENVVKVDRLTENLGPKRSVFTPERQQNLPRYFCVTDPDIVFNRFLPDDFISQLIDQTKTQNVGKAGFALNLLNRHLFSDTTVHLLRQKWKIWEWEELFWTNRVGRTQFNDAVFRADIDTTFALYDRDQWSRNAFFKAVRVAGRFTADHAPWYAQSDVPDAERDAYRSESTYSYYKM